MVAECQKCKDDAHGLHDVVGGLIKVCKCVANLNPGGHSAPPGFDTLAGFGYIKCLISKEIHVQAFAKRSHTCGELRPDFIGKNVTLNGWVDVRRDLGGVIFIDLRDRYGKTQVVFNPQQNGDAHQLAKELRSEFVISVTGTVEMRPEGTVNPESGDRAD